MSRNRETAFLPAAIEIQETPPSPIGRMITWTIMVFFVLAIVWASIGEIDIVAVTQGRIIPSGHSKTVQPLEIGTVTAIYVREGQAVSAGDILVELDSTHPKADVERLEEERQITIREIGRLTILLDWLQRIANNLPTQATNDDPLL